MYSTIQYKTLVCINTKAKLWEEEEEKKKHTKEHSYVFTVESSKSFRTVERTTKLRTALLTNAAHDGENSRALLT